MSMLESMPSGLGRLPGKWDVGEAIPDPRQELAEHEKEAQPCAVPDKRRHKRERDKRQHDKGSNPSILL